jgi:hypothetical protein
MPAVEVATSPGALLVIVTSGHHRLHELYARRRCAFAPRLQKHLLAVLTTPIVKSQHERSRDIKTGESLKLVPFEAGTDD